MGVGTGGGGTVITELDRAGQDRRAGHRPGPSLLGSPAVRQHFSTPSPPPTSPIPVQPPPTAPGLSLVGGGGSGFPAAVCFDAWGVRCRPRELAFDPHILSLPRRALPRYSSILYTVHRRLLRPTGGPTGPRGLGSSLSPCFSAHSCASPHLNLQLPVSVSPPLLGGNSSPPGSPAGPLSSFPV